MSNAIYPQLPGVKWDQIKIPIFNTISNRVISGKESRVSLAQYPYYEYILSYELLRDNTVNNELKTLMGFYMQRQGSFDSFLYIDPSDNIAVTQFVGTGDGNTKTFQLYRTYGGWVDPITDIQPAGSPTPVLNVYLTGVVQPTGWSVGYYQSGILTFTVAPGSGVSITADFSFYRRVRFKEYEEDSGDAFSEFMYNLWSLGKVYLLQDRL